MKKYVFIISILGFVLVLVRLTIINVYDQTKPNLSLPIKEIPLFELPGKIPLEKKLPTTGMSLQYEPDFGQQHYVLNNGDPKDKLDILFIPQQIQDITAIPLLIQKIFYVDDTTYNDFDGLFQRDTFNQFQNKFNIS